MTQKIACGVFVVFAFVGSYWLHYLLPKKEIIYITGIDSKRSEGIPTRKDTPNAQGLDVFFIYANDEKGRPVIFENQNTAWGWPPYFKFDAADTQGLAQNLTGKKSIATYYGWRNKFLNLFPNLISLQEAGENTSLTPWSRNIIFTVWFLFILLIFPGYYELFSQKTKKN